MAPGPGHARGSGPAVTRGYPQWPPRRAASPLLRTPRRRREAGGGGSLVMATPATSGWSISRSLGRRGQQPHLRTRCWWGGRAGDQSCAPGGQAGTNSGEPRPASRRASSGHPPGRAASPGSGTGVGFNRPLAMSRCARRQVSFQSPWKGGRSRTGSESLRPAGRSPGQSPPREDLR